MNSPAQCGLAPLLAPWAERHPPFRTPPPGFEPGTRSINSRSALPLSYRGLGDSCRIRTYDRLLRRQLLYPAELTSHLRYQHIIRLCGIQCQPVTLLKPFPEFQPPGPSWKFSEPPRFSVTVVQLLVAAS